MDGGCVLGRRGMSPLIATVLLMAFAVALGGMIMNWSIDVSTSGECDAIKVHVEQFCTEEGKVRLRMQNLPSSVPLQGIKLIVTSENVENTLTVRGSEVDAGAPLEILIPYAGGTGAKVDLVGVIGSAADPYTCSEAPIGSVDPIGPC